MSIIPHNKIESLITWICIKYRTANQRRVSTVLKASRYDYLKFTEMDKRKKNITATAERLKTPTPITITPPA
jgi:hypothetical protein